MTLQTDAGRERRIHTAFSAGCLVLLLLAIAPSQAAAQGGAEPAEGWVQRGERLRITAPALGEGVLIGRLAALGVDTLLLEQSAGGRRGVPITTITRVQVSDGRAYGAGAAIGAGLGSLAGVGLGVLCVAVCPTEPGGGANMAPAGGLLLGFPVGLLGGLLLAPERWRTIPLPGSAAAPSRGSGQPEERETDDVASPKTWTLHVGAGSSKAWNMIGITKELLLHEHVSLFATASPWGTIMLGGGMAFYTNRDGHGLFASATGGIAGAHAQVGGQLGLGRFGFLTAGVGYGSYFLQHEGMLPFLGYEFRL